MSQEERKKNIQRLRQHVNNEIMKDTQDKSGKGTKDRKQAAISNAFQLNLKNQKEEVLKNMENLRKSVKMKKRANPLEKIITKLKMPEYEE